MSIMKSNYFITLNNHLVTKYELYQLIVIKQFRVKIFILLFIYNVVTSPAELPSYGGRPSIYLDQQHLSRAIRH